MPDTDGHLGCELRQLATTRAQGLGRQQPFPMRLRQSPKQHLTDDVLVQQLLSVRREDLEVPFRFIEFYPDEPAEQRAVPDLIDELPIATDREKELQQQRAHRLLRPDWAANRRATPYAKPLMQRDRKSTRLNSSHGYISYAVFCLKKKK